MVVGLKRRRNSDKYYELGIALQREIRKHQKFVYDDSGKGVSTRDFCKDEMLVQVFNPVTRGRNWKITTHYLWVRVVMVDVLCEYLPGKCGNEECKYRFRCGTTKYMPVEEY